VGIVIAMYFTYTWPKKLEMTIPGFLISQDKGAPIKSVQMTLKGTHYHCLTRQDKFAGTIEIEGNEYDIRAFELESLEARFTSFTSKLKGEPISLYSLAVKDGLLSIGGIIFVSDDYNQLYGHIQEIRDQYEDQSIMFSGPTKTFEETKTIINDN
jgi:hypothetical protein